ncbi:prepilin-type N-terminal cleavage/methylation domain-containing protein [Massilia sp. 9096]|uniref:prepilin-type N-terminal cleavage/methylation domain-containing protein n=1 Tax=Massilia sp. 9096 TaxID=1500894 RepID=UPI000563EB50|nr:prepilin-type N-terminal cleavage/methylation domain-containing protein [Massilia sp. 9096]
MTLHAHAHAYAHPPARPRTHARGFTLIEVIVSIVVIGILSAIVAVFIRAPILGYRDTVDRAEITDQADLALRRIARDLRLALPNSVRIASDGAGNTVMEFLQTKTGGRYLSIDDDGVDPTRILNFEDPIDTDFTAIAPLNSFAQVAVGDYVVVYNLGPGLEPANAYVVQSAACTKGDATSAAVNAGNIAQISKIVTPSASGLADAVDITLAVNPFACQAPPMSSPNYRFQVVSGPVSFYCTARSDGTWDLWRAWGYKIQAGQPTSTPSDAKTAMLASRLTRCDKLFSYSTAANQRTGLVGIDISLHGRNDNTAAIRLVHQVHVDNTP